MMTLHTKIRLTCIALLTAACGDSAGAPGGHIHIENGTEPATGAADGDTQGHANGDGAHGDAAQGAGAADGGSTADAAQQVEDGGKVDAGDAPVSCVGAADGAPCTLGKHCAGGQCIADMCGDGLRSGAEECDDGNGVNTDGCTKFCRAAKCGDGYVGPSEACDDGNGVNTDTCTNTCKSAACGDNIRSSTEPCDDGNTTGGDGCSATCTVEATGTVCGNGEVEGTEQCDDGNSVDSDSCTNACKNAKCGDGIKAAAEECDDGNTSYGDGCSGTCTDECARCQSENCRTYIDGVDLVDACFHAQGVAAAGPKAGTARRDLCLAFVDCVHRTKCADAQVDVCYCGSVAFATCTISGGNGPCRAELEAAAESTDPDAVTQRTGTLEFVSGAAYNLVLCERDWSCLPLCE